MQNWTPCEAVRMFDFDIAPQLREEIAKLSKKNRPLADELKAKMREVTTRDNRTVEFYKNLRAPMNAFKRVHVGSFVLLFSVIKERNMIIFYEFLHHDEAYK